MPDSARFPPKSSLGSVTGPPLRTEGRPFFCASNALKCAAPMTDRRKAVVLLSGGLDSMVTAAIASERGFDVLALTVNYGQRHSVELE